VEDRKPHLDLGRASIQQLRAIWPGGFLLLVALLLCLVVVGLVLDAVLIVSLIAPAVIALGALWLSKRNES